MHVAQMKPYSEWLSHTLWVDFGFGVFFFQGKCLMITFGVTLLLVDQVLPI